MLSQLAQSPGNLYVELCKYYAGFDLNGGKTKNSIAILVKTFVIGGKFWLVLPQLNFNAS
jgi:hypothetical protein